MEKKSINWVAWETLIAPKKVGGTRLGSIKNLNISLLAKWMWRLKNENSELWAKVIRCIHGLDGRHWSIFANRYRTGVWKNIVKIRPVLKNLNIDPNEIVYWKSTEGCWVSDFGMDGQFFVRLLRERIEMASHMVCDGPLDWCKVIPIKIL